MQKSKKHFPYLLWGVIDDLSIDIYTSHETIICVYTNFTLSFSYNMQDISDLVVRRKLLFL